MQALPVRRGIPATTNGTRTPHMIQEKCPICEGVSARLMGVKDGLRVLRREEELQSSLIAQHHAALRAEDTDQAQQHADQRECQPSW